MLISAPHTAAKCSVMAIALFISTVCSAQQPENRKAAPAQTATARLVSAKNVLITRTHGSQIPNDVIRATVEGWERFNFVTSADKADLLMEVATSGGDNSVRESSFDWHTGQNRTI